MSQKLAASTLKIVQIYTKQGDLEKAQMMYERVTGECPDSPEAEVARKAMVERIARAPLSEYEMLKHIYLRHCGIAAD